MRYLPGQKDTKSVKTGTKREGMRKLLLQSCLHQAHQKFLKEYPGSKVCYSKFCSLRPPNVVLQGSAGSHVTCVCLHCSNPRLLIETSVLSKLDCFKYLVDENGVEKLTVEKLLKR